MTFLAPAMLFAAGAVAVPVIIHLLNKTQTRRVPWAAMRFLLECVEKNRRRMRLEEWLLLLLRCLLVALLALAFARPVWNTLQAALPGGKNVPVAAVVLVDDSLSMSYEWQGETSFGRARKEAARILDGLPAGSRAAIFLASDQIRKIVPELEGDLPLVARALDGLAPGYGAGNLTTAIGAAVETLTRQSELPGEIYVVTDNQQFAWRDITSVPSLLEKAKGRVALRVRFVGAPEAGNASVSALQLDDSVPVPGQPVSCRVAVSNWNSSPLTNLPVKLVADGKPAAEGVIPRIAPGQTETQELMVRFDRGGFHTLTAAIPHDALPADDERSRAVTAAEQTRIVIVEENAGRRLSERDSFFLSHALSPVTSGQSFHLKALTLPVAELSPERLEGINVVILANIAQLPPEKARALHDFVVAGGGLMVFPGPATNVAFYNDDPVFAPLLPARLGRKMETDDGAAPPLLQDRGFSHSVLSLWNDPRLTGLGGVYFSSYFPLKPLEGTTVAAAMTGGQPAIVEGRVGKGRVILFNSTATTRWTNLPLDASFVPLLHRLVGYVASHTAQQTDLSPGMPLVLSSPAFQTGREFFVSGPDGKMKSGGRIETGGVLRYAATEKPGAYQIFLDAGGAEPVAAFAVSVNPAEANLWPVPAAELAALQPFEKVQEANVPSGDVRPPVGEGTQLGLLLGALALAMAVGEMALAWKIGRSYQS